MKLSLLPVAIISFSLGLAGCDNETASSDTTSEKAQASEDSEEAAPVAKEEAPEKESETITLAKVDNLKVDVTPGTTPTEVGRMVMIMSMHESFTVQAASADDPKNIDAAKKEAESTYNGKNFQEEKLEDGWSLSYQNEGEMGPTFFLAMRRSIGDKDYMCSTSVAFETQREGAIAACKTLRK